MGIKMELEWGRNVELRGVQNTENSIGKSYSAQMV